MNSVNKTLYIPLYGKAYVSRRGILLEDPKAEQIWATEGFELKGKSRSKWLALYMGIRAYVFDQWVKQQKADLVLHIGCGLDSRAERIGKIGKLWYDIDFPEVIAERRLYYRESEDYKMLGADVRGTDWLRAIPTARTAVVMEGVSMYMTRQELIALLTSLNAHFDGVTVLMDCYTELAARASRIRNPINDVGVTQVYGLDDPMALEKSGLRFLGEQEMTPREQIDQLQGMEKRIFRALYAGSIARKMYRLYEYGTEVENDSKSC